VQLAGPSLAGIASRAAQAVADPAYRGQATDAAGYIRESILAPSAHLVPGQMFSAGGVSFMPTTYGESLDEPQVEQLVAYLSSLK
jgi:nitric oxide reductase subunit C